MAAPKETDIQKMKPTQRAKGSVYLTLSTPLPPTAAADEPETICATDSATLKDGDIPVTFGLNSMKDRQRDCVNNIK